MTKLKTKNITLLIVVIFLFYSANALAADLEAGDFYVDGDYDADLREKVGAVLIKKTPSVYFYVEKSWWNGHGQAFQEETLSNLDKLSIEFENRIYPTLTATFGSEGKSTNGADNKISILFHSMKSGVKGYFRTTDEYQKIQAPTSNEKKMLYISLSQINNPQLKSYVAHEFLHLITFNQKEKIRGVQEEVWLNEARAEYAITLLGYNSPYSASNLQVRLADFLQDPTDSLTEWQNKIYDYGSANAFAHYLVDHYGLNILVDSMKSNLTGILSINEALKRNGFKEDFAQIFTDWTIASLINDCSKGLKYCYLSPNFSSFSINPMLNFLPTSGSSSLSVTNTTKNWSGNWQKIIGGKGDLNLEFSNPKGLLFKVPYLVYDKNGNYSLKFIDFSEEQYGKVEIKNFGHTYASLIIIPSLQAKFEDFGGFELSYIYSFTATITEQPDIQSNKELQQSLLAKIADLKKQIAELIARGAVAGQSTQLCYQLTQDLYLGIENFEQVKCLQEFLKKQGPEIYLEGLVTGYFGNLTKSAVIRFQEKYASEILAPIKLYAGTGFVGPATRIKINQLVNND